MDDATKILTLAQTCARHVVLRRRGNGKPHRPGPAAEDWEALYVLLGRKPTAKEQAAFKSLFVAHVELLVSLRE